MPTLGLSERNKNEYWIRQLAMSVTPYERLLNPSFMLVLPVETRARNYHLIGKDDRLQCCDDKVGRY